MKVFEFDFATGRKGKVLAEVHCTGNGMGIGIFTRYTVHEFFSTVKGKEAQEGLTADDFGVEAVAFCIGEVDGVWDWKIVPSKALVEKAIARNKTKWGHAHWKFL